MNERILAMPRLGETMEEGKLVGWLIAPGESFRRGDPIVEIETDKTIAEFPALGDGRLIEVLATIDEVIEVGAPLARIDIGDGPDWTQGEQEAAEAPVEAAPDAVTPATDAPTHAPEPQHGRVRATPLARRLARQHGLDVSAIAGSGRRGRVEKADVLASVGNLQEPAADLRFATLRSGRMAYQDSGAASVRAVLLLHGFAGDHTTWATIAAGLKRRGRRAIAPDLPGHGQTGIEARDAADLARDLPEFLDALGIAEVEIVAHSLGAVAALDLAQAVPERVISLSLIAPAGLGAEIDADFVRGIAHADAPGGIAHLLRRLSLNPMELSQAALTALAGELSKGRLTALADALAGDFGQKVDTLAAIRKLSGKLPIRVLFGLEDRIIPWQHALALPPAVAVHFLARSGHMPQWDQSQDVLDILIG